MDSRADFCGDLVDSRPDVFDLYGEWDRLESDKVEPLALGESGGAELFLRGIFLDIVLSDPGRTRARQLQLFLL